MAPTLTYACTRYRAILFQIAMVRRCNMRSSESRHRTRTGVVREISPLHSKSSRDHRRQAIPLTIFRSERADIPLVQRIKGIFDRVAILGQSNKPLIGKPNSGEKRTLLKRLTIQMNRSGTGQGMLWKRRGQPPRNKMPNTGKSVPRNDGSVREARFTVEASRLHSLAGDVSVIA